MRELTVESGKANLLGLLFAVLFFPVMVLPFYFIWGDSIQLLSEIQQLKGDLLWIFLIILLSMVIHELLHGAAYLALTRGDFKNIKFGIIWQFITPYCHYKQPIPIWKYRVAVLTPGIFTGLIPFVLSLFFGNFALLFFSILFTFGAVGDFIIIWMIRHEKSMAMVQDHPDKIGCIMEH